MSQTDPLEPVLGASEPRHRPQRTLAGALATGLLLWVVLSAFVAPVLTATAVGGVVGLGLLAAAVRYRPQSDVRLCLPGTNQCVDL